MARSPCARLTTFMTPNMSDSPQANRAYRPPVRIPWVMALTQAITAVPPRGDYPPQTPPAPGGTARPPSPPGPPFGGVARPFGAGGEAEVGGLDLGRGDVRRTAFQGGMPLEQALQMRCHPQRLADVLL